VAHGEVVEPGGDGAVAFELVDAALHGVTLFVGLGVEGGWSAAGGTGGSAVAPSDLVVDG
jgi:hypothetical protein